MSDATLLAYGCAVTFIALSGAYIYMREISRPMEPRKAAKARVVTVSAAPPELEVEMEQVRSAM